MSKSIKLTVGDFKKLKAIVSFGIDIYKVYIQIGNCEFSRPSVLVELMDAGIKFANSVADRKIELSRALVDDDELNTEFDNDTIEGMLFIMKFAKDESNKLDLTDDTAKGELVELNCNVDYLTNLFNSQISA